MRNVHRKSPNSSMLQVVELVEIRDVSIGMERKPRLLVR